MKIYLDNCSLQRPLDDQTQTRVQMETYAISQILDLCESRGLTLVSSAILLFEISKIGDAERRQATEETLQIAGNLSS